MYELTIQFARSHYDCLRYDDEASAWADARATVTFLLASRLPEVHLQDMLRQRAVSHLDELSTPSLMSLFRRSLEGDVHIRELDL